jgi:ABC-type uncharacterized transport system ATPase subunit
MGRHDAMVTSTSKPTVQIQNIRKAFSGVTVLDDITFDLLGGEVHTLMGENGAGKSTLMNILAGVHRPSGGSFLLDGKEVIISSPQAALRLGIALIHQEPLNFPALSAFHRANRLESNAIAGARSSGVAGCRAEPRRADERAEHRRSANGGIGGRLVGAGARAADG